MRKICLYVIALFCIVSCRDHIDIEKLINVQNDTQKLFENEFTARYGNVSPDMNWMTAGCDTILADLTALESGKEYIVRVFTSNPVENGKNCYLLAEYCNITGGTSTEIEYDFPVGLNKVFVTASISDEVGYFAIAETNEEDCKVVFSDDSYSSATKQYKPMGYLICYEGFTGDDNLDFDYNDLIIEVQYVRGQKQASIKSRAAGCECAIRLAYQRSDNIENEETIFEEVHSSMGYDGLYDYYEGRIVYLVLNTGINTSSKIGSSSLELLDEVGASILQIAPKFYAYFTITATKKNDEQTTNAFIPRKKGASYPQAILVADPTWNWSKEERLLSSSHSTFHFWIVEPEKYPLWYGGEMWKEANKNFE